MTANQRTWTAAAHVCLCVLIAAAAAAAMTTSAVGAQRRDNYKLCDVRGCNCTAQTSWTIVNCTFDSEQNVDLHKSSVPETTVELNIVGGKLLTVHALTFRDLAGFGLLSVDGTKMVVLKEQAFDNVRTASVLDVRVAGCSYLLLETRAFKNMLTSIRCELTRCEHVELRSGVFGRLQEAKISNVRELHLAEGAFLFENQTEIGRHGIVTNISFHNVTIPDIPRRAFVSALSSIELTNCQVGRISSQAFAAISISAISIVDSHVGELSSGALSERTLIKLLLLRNASVDLLESQAVMAAIANITVEFSSIRTIETGAINCSLTANIVISNNKLATLAPRSLVFRGWNVVRVEHNIMRRLRANFLSVPYNDDVVRFSFSGNEIHEADAHAFDSLPELRRRLVRYRFDDNSFHEDCRCRMDAWMSTLMNDTGDVQAALATSYCKVNRLIATCFDIRQELITIANYTTLACGPGSDISCEPYRGATKPLSNGTFARDERAGVADAPRLPHVLLIVALVVLATAGTLAIVAVRGGLWLRRKGYCARFKYDRDDDDNARHDDEGAMVVAEEAAAAAAAARSTDQPELTNELLHELREQLKNPETHDKAREMIESLYERFVIDESCTNNNRQDDEAHLYEELGNMQHAPNGVATPLDTDDYLKVMAERINHLPLIDADCQPPLVVQQQYSEPADAAVHVYSELKNRSDAENTLGSSNGTLGSGKMALRPLPDKPGPSNRSEY